MTSVWKPLQSFFLDDLNFHHLFQHSFDLDAFKGLLVVIHLQGLNFLQKQLMYLGHHCRKLLL